MSKPGRACSICAAPATKAVVDAELGTGSMVSEVVERWAAEFSFSPASAYRHARHRRRPGHPLSADHPEGEGPADIIRGLVNALRAAVAQLARAEANADERLVTASAERIRSVSHELVAVAGVDYELIVTELTGLHRLVATLRDAATRNPQLIDDLAAEVELAGSTETAHELRELAAFARVTRANAA